MKLGYHHARYFESGVCYHIVTRTIGGQFLFTPDRARNLERMAYGVLAKALENWPSIKLHCFALMSNHMHLMVTPESHADVPKFMRFVKGELSYRWGQRGSKWQGRYKATALLTAEAQRGCFQYVLSQGAKEGLVRDPLQWPSAHAAKYWFKRRKPLLGGWVDGTAMAIARNRGTSPQAKDYTQKKSLHLSLPGLMELSYAELRVMHKSIIADARTECGNKRVLGLDKIFSVKPWQRSELPSMPWEERRKTIVAWVSSTTEVVQEYLRRYFNFQKAFRVASDYYLESGLGIDEFPSGAWLPGKYLVSS